MPKQFTLTSLNPGCPPYRQPYCSVGSRNTRSTTKYAVTSRSTTQVVPFDLPPWSSAQCQSARKKYHLARRINRLTPSSINKQNLKDASQHYKRTMNFHINKFNRDTQEKFRKLKTDSPKDFWKLINNLERDKGDQNISLESLYTFFKDLNTSNEQPDDENFAKIDISDDDEFLNSPITEAEIRKCIKALKYNKCPANDRILNEYLKCSSDKMIPIYISLFNVILDRGIIPDFTTV